MAPDNSRAACPAPQDQQAADKLRTLAKNAGLDIAGGCIRRSSSRFCLGVEHGDYNGTELFGVGTDRFIWLAYKANDSGRIRLFSGNFPEDGVIEFVSGQVPPPKTVKDAWSRFPFGVDHILTQAGHKLSQGIDIVLWGNIPGGGMSRSASLTLNLILTFFEVNNISVTDDFGIIDLAQAVENQYIGSPCGQLDQIMIYFAREGQGTHYDPATRTITYVPFGGDVEAFRIVCMDTGTDRPGLEKSTYKVRRDECERLVKLAKDAGITINALADVKDEGLYNQILSTFSSDHPGLCRRLTYIFQAQQRFYRMLDAWKAGDIETVGALFRADGLGLRDTYQISGPELETMCDIVRTVPGVFGERMLGGGDKGASGALVQADSVAPLEEAVKTAYLRSRPDFHDRFALHTCKVVNGINTFAGLLNSK